VGPHARPQARSGAGSKGKARKRGCLSAPGSWRRLVGWCPDRRGRLGVVGGHQATLPQVGVPAGPVVVGQVAAFDLGVRCVTPTAPWRAQYPGAASRWAGS